MLQKTIMLLFQLMSINKCLVTAWLIAFVLPIIIVNCLHVVPEGANTFEHHTTLVTGLQVIILVSWILFLKRFTGCKVTSFFLAESCTYQSLFLFLQIGRGTLFLDFWLSPKRTGRLIFILSFFRPTPFTLFYWFFIITVKAIKIQF